MASGDGKSNPFGNGTSGAVGNDGGTAQGMVKNRGIDRPQKMGASNFNPDSVPAGGRVLKIDPKGDRSGLLGQNVNGMLGKKPFKVGGNGPSMPAGNGEPDDAATAGQLPTSDMSDGGSDD